MIIKLSINGYDIKFDTLKFSDSAISIKLTGTLPTHPVNATISVVEAENLQDELFTIASLVSVLRDINSDIRIDLFMPYTPYARQDRRMDRHDAFSMKVYASMLNALKLNRVIVMDAHSDVAPALIDRCINIPQDFILKTLNRIDATFGYDCVLVSPDMGATKKIHKASEVLPTEGVLYMNKVRDTKTGQISGVKLLGGIGEWVKGKKLLIVDDLCDGGGTFIQAANELMKYNPASIELYVTHGIFSKGLAPIFNSGIYKIWTTDSIKNGYKGTGPNLTKLNSEIILQKWFEIH